MTVRTKQVNGALRWYSEPPADTYRLIITCPRCAADLEHVTSGSRWSWQQAAAISCSECRWQGVINVELTEMSPDRKPTRKLVPA